MDTRFFLKAYDFLYETFSNSKLDFNTIFAEFPEVIPGCRKNDLDIQLFSFNNEIECILLMFLRMGFPMLKSPDIESGKLDFIINSGPSDRWILLSYESPPNSWSISIDTLSEFDRKKFIINKMLVMISAFEQLYLCIINVNNSYSDKM